MMKFIGNSLISLIEIPNKISFTAKGLGAFPPIEEPLTIREEIDWELILQINFPRIFSIMQWFFVSEISAYYLDDAMISFTFISG